LQVLGTLDGLVPESALPEKGSWRRPCLHTSPTVALPAGGEKSRHIFRGISMACFLVITRAYNWKNLTGTSMFRLRAGTIRIRRNGDFRFRAPLKPTSSIVRSYLRN